jgi:hypothetical protein
MTRAHRFAFGHEPPRARAALPPASSGDEITAPLGDYVAPPARPWQVRTTLTLVEVAAPMAPVPSFHEPEPPAPREVVPEAAPVVAPRRRVALYVVIGLAALALYSAALVEVVAPRRTVEVVAAPAALTAVPVVAPSASTAPPPEPSASAAVPSATASVSSPPPRATPARVVRPPAPARTTQPVSDVRNPWKYD